ncbi:MAG: glycosyltransferase family 4 protein [Pyrinomonadaceae bacterium]
MESTTSTNLQIVRKSVRQIVFRVKKARAHSTEPIRVLRIAHASLTPALRGRERGIALRFPEIEMEVITAPRWLEAGIDTETVSSDLFPVHTARTFFSKHMQLFAYDPRPIIKALRRHRPHIIDMDHEPYSVPCAEVISLRNRCAPTTPIVMQAAQNIYKDYPLPFSLLEKRALKQIDAAYMCSEAARDVLREKGFDKPTRIVPFGVDTEMFRCDEKCEPQETFTIGYVGRLLPAKGLMVLAESLTKIKEEKWRLLVVGSGEEKEKMERLFAENGLLERVHFVGAVPYEKTPEYFRQIDVLVVPTRTTSKIREQFGRVIIEAMACGTPVIGSTSGAIPEVIGEAGIVFPENDPEFLAAELRYVMKNRQLLAKLARAGKRRVENNYTWQRVAEGIHSLYRETLWRKAAAEGKKFVL